MTFRNEKKTERRNLLVNNSEKQIPLEVRIALLRKLEQAYLDTKLTLPSDPNYHEANRRRNQILTHLQKLERIASRMEVEKKISSSVKLTIGQTLDNISSSPTIVFQSVTVESKMSGNSKKYRILIELEDMVGMEPEGTFPLSEKELSFLKTGLNY